MDQRYGAWAQLLTLFRLVYDGGRHGGLQLPARKGYLFDPDRYPFLEGRPKGSQRPAGRAARAAPRLRRRRLPRPAEPAHPRRRAAQLPHARRRADRLVYETIMGFSLEVAGGRSIAVKPTKAHGAPATINLEELLPPSRPSGRMAQGADRPGASPAQAAERLKAATTPEDAGRRPGDEGGPRRRRRTSCRPGRWSSSPVRRAPAVRLALHAAHRSPSRSSNDPEPILKQLGEPPTPEQILDLKVCDPAMGSGAFLVEACRHLGDELVKAWHAHKRVPTHPAGRGRSAARPPPGRPALPLRRGQEPDGRRPRQALALAGDAGEGPPVHVPRPRPALRRFAGRPTREQIVGFHWKPDRQQDFAPAAIEGQLNRALRTAPAGSSRPATARPTPCSSGRSSPAADGFLNLAASPATWSSPPSSPATTTGSARTRLDAARSTDLSAQYLYDSEPPRPARSRSTVCAPAAQA